MLPVIQKLTVYSEVSYAVPYSLLVDPWLMKTDTMQQSFMSDLMMPPPSGTWNGAWWDVWTIKEMNTYLKRMVDNGLSNLYPLPAGPPDGELTCTTLLAYSYGGSVLNSQGRCGLLDNNKTVEALTDTTTYWRSLTNWPIDALLMYNSSDPVSVASVDPSTF
ncbi:hypothetical protein HDV00_005263 [Rhizophlyctis rosea]|nr:hypothetical protein HDV00_005263 [Rhizophlyctis rosea]